MNQRGVWVYAGILGLFGTGCTMGSLAAPPVQAAAPAPPPSMCPESIAADAPLETDGGRAWIALGEPPSHQLIAPSVSLLPKKNQLFLEVKLEYVNRLRLDAEGHFVQSPTGR